MVSRSQYHFDNARSDSLLLVEGIDDARFFAAFLKSLGIDHVQIAAVGGKDNFAPLWWPIFCVNCSGAKLFAAPCPTSLPPQERLSFRLRVLHGLGQVVQPFLAPWLEV